MGEAFSDTLKIDLFTPSPRDHPSGGVEPYWPVCGVGEALPHLHTPASRDQKQSIARSIFQLSRRDREFLPFSLMLRDEIENFCLSVSCFETRSRISSLQSHASRRDREFLSFGLVLRDEIEIQLGVSGNTPRRDCGVCLKLLAPWTVVIDWYQLPKFKTQDYFLLLSVL